LPEPKWLSWLELDLDLMNEAFVLSERRTQRRPRATEPEAGLELDAAIRPAFEFTGIRIPGEPPRIACSIGSCRFRKMPAASTSPNPGTTRFARRSSRSWRVRDSIAHELQPADEPVVAAATAR
jgi:hypothetical protein